MVNLALTCCGRKQKTVIFITNSQELQDQANHVITFDLGDAEHIKMADADTNQDGMVDLQEYLALGGKEAHFRMFDSDGDGFLDKDEQRLAEEQTTKMEATRRRNAILVPTTTTGNS